MFIKDSNEKSILKSVLACAAFMLLVSYANAEYVMIDDFSEPGQNITSKGQQAWSDTNSNVLGGVRDGSVGCESSEADGRSTANISNGLFAVTTNHKAAPSIYLSYDGLAGWGNHLDDDPFNDSLSPSQDLTAGGADAFSIEFVHADEGDSGVAFFNDVLLTVKMEGQSNLYQYNANTEANSWMDTNYNLISESNPMAFEVEFAKLGNGTSTDIDMAKVEAVGLHICSENYDLEYTLNSFSTVPEPATLALLGSGLIMLRRKRR
ncbi:PEP-CTERM sorting domain-containing protein [Sedimentisphaera salicampi]|uniref:PEP-CTERM sorting domain-containing protein n=1 Tax=Sedimentisphaera salicampi TaxID=1941349 RepID=UPI000B9A581E|nr:PEP-CTERM sorting domain-containing protein [Sedimentisphaera salicampi]OXU15110.1 hypothetical protein SMSP1_01040 [Sedimentisphaera salicampi]